MILMIYVWIVWEDLSLGLIKVSISIKNEKNVFFILLIFFSINLK